MTMLLAYNEQWQLNEFLWSIWCATLAAALFYFPIVYFYLLPREKRIKESYGVPSYKKPPSPVQRLIFMFLSGCASFFPLFIIYVLSFLYITGIFPVLATVNEQAELFYTSIGEQCKASQYKTPTTRYAIDCPQNTSLLGILIFVIEIAAVKIFFLAQHYLALIFVTLLQFGRCIWQHKHAMEMHRIQIIYWKAARNMLVFSLILFLVYGIMLRMNGDINHLLYPAIILYFIPFNIQCRFVSFLGKVLEVFDTHRGHYKR